MADCVRLKAYRVRGKTMGDWTDYAEAEIYVPIEAFYDYVVTLEADEEDMPEVDPYTDAPEWFILPPGMES